MIAHLIVLFLLGPFWQMAAPQPEVNVGYLIDGGAGDGNVVRPEPSDVPAVQLCCEYNAGCYNTDDGSIVSYHSCVPNSWTCADKTRILMHDEQNPPKFWCHRPEEGP